MGGMKSGGGETMPEIPDWLKDEVQPLMQNAANVYRSHHNYATGIGLPQQRNSPGLREEDMFGAWDPAFQPQIMSPWDQPPPVQGDDSGSASKG